MSDKLTIFDLPLELVVLCTQNFISFTRFTSTCSKFHELRKLDKYNEYAHKLLFEWIDKTKKENNRKMVELIKENQKMEVMKWIPFRVAKAKDILNRCPVFVVQDTNMHKQLSHARYKMLGGITMTSEMYTRVIYQHGGKPNYIAALSTLCLDCGFSDIYNKPSFIRGSTFPSDISPITMLPIGDGFDSDIVGPDPFREMTEQIGVRSVFGFEEMIKTVSLKEIQDCCNSNDESIAFELDNGATINIFRTVNLLLVLPKDFPVDAAQLAIDNYNARYANLKLHS